MRIVVVKWKQESRKDSREAAQFRAVLTFEGTCKKVAAVEVSTTAALGEVVWLKPHDQSRISDEQIIMRALEALASHFIGRRDLMGNDAGTWMQIIGATIRTYEADAQQLMEIDLGTVRS